MVVADPNSPFTAAGHALVACGEAAAPALSIELESLGFRVTLAADPYHLLLQLLDEPLVYDAVVLSLPAIYRDELAIIRTIRERVAHVEVLLAHVDGRHAMLAEAMRLGATGLLDAEGIHRLAPVHAPFAPAPTRAESVPDRNENAPAVSSETEEADVTASTDDGEPILTVDELRALLAEHPASPPN